MSRSELIDEDFANELAVAADVLFEPDHPADPRPTLRALTTRDEVVLDLHTTYCIAASLLQLVSVDDSGMTRLELAHELVQVALDGVWEVTPHILATVERAVYLLEDGAPPPLGQENFIPMVLFVLGLSATISAKLNVAPSDAIRGCF